MINHMWELIEDCPSGCVQIEALYLEDDSIIEMFSCDVHWDKSQGKPIPDFFRLISDDYPKREQWEW
jgi:hypothetical protein